MDLENWRPWKLRNATGSGAATIDFDSDEKKRFYRIRELAEGEPEPAESGGIWVSAKNGNDATGTPGVRSKPFETLGAALNAMESGQTVFVHNGVYSIDPEITGREDGPPKAPLQINGKQDVSVVGLGNNVRIEGKGPGDFLNVQNCENVRIENITFEGNNPDANGDGGGLFATILLRGDNEHIVIRECRFLKFGNHGISHLFRPKNSRFVTVNGCYFRNGGDAEVPELNVDGSAISGVGAHWTIYNNRIERCVRGIEIEGASRRFPSRNILIQGNQVVEVADRGITLFATNTTEENYRDITISGNMIVGSDVGGSGAGHGISLDGGVRVAVRGNRIRGMAAWGIGITTGGLNDFRDGVIMNNYVADCGTSANKAGGVVLWQRKAQAGIEQTVVKGNVVQGCHGPGIDANGRRLSIMGNVVYNNARSLDGSGIEVSRWLGEGGSSNIIKGNSSFGTGSTKAQEYGIWVREGVRAALVVGNVVRDKDHGIEGIRNDGEGTRVTGNITARD